MEMGSDEKVGLMRKGFEWVKGLVGKLGEVRSKAIALGKDDPRRVIHSLKLGLALTIVSILYYYNPLYANFGVSAMWAVMTVVVVFEFSVGATLRKGLNRTFATLFAGALGAGAHYLAALSGHVGQPIITSIFVFLLACILTFMRFVPSIKAKYDYGMMIGILTFALVSISGIQDDEVVLLFEKRISTIFLGVCVCVLISISISPVWAGQDLHNRIALNIENLAIFLEGYGSVECLKSLQDEQFTQEYKSILKSSGIEETLYNSARWEPGHGCFQFRHPWNQYLKIGALTSQCAFRIDALCRNLSSSNIQVSQKIQTEIQETCMEMSMESGKALRQLVSSIRELTQPTQAQIYTQNSKSAAKRLKTSLRSSDFWEDCDFLTLVPAATVGLLLVDVVECTEKISEAVQELASLAHFKSGKAEAMQSEKEKVQPNIGVSFVTIPISSV
ncbi:aluminum-activated malate transporter 2-like isoform X1 [Cucurbita moschata]|uniref:Aluminum-activated malate transporter 2-like isoform X1 n=1 Tax=Cucurbita moschata TaxID=3662 RepID=A0A6J1EWX7_CUCMO|nr:aluminum-activated malate transporter 2-like isoform X1 [Cucurbita moschata]